MNINDLDKFPELHNDTFPFRGFRDFRGFKEEDYASFAAGLYRKLDSPMFPDEDQSPYRCYWFGGADRWHTALDRLIACGITCLVEPPLQGAHWYRIRFNCDGAK